MRHLSAAFTAIRRSPYQSLAAILILSLTFFVGYTFSLVALGSEQILHYFETRPQVTAFFKVDTTPDVVNGVEKSMRDKTYVNQINVVTKEQALQIYQEDNKKDPLLLSLVTSDILPASIEVSGKDASSLPRIKDDLEKSPGVEDVVYETDVINALNTGTQSLRYIGLGAIVLLGLTSFLIIVIITGMKVAIQKRAIRIMRILGASKWYVKAPFVYEGMLYGLFGSLIGWSGMFVGLLYLTPWLDYVLGGIKLLPVPPEVFLIQLLSGTVVGMVMGAFASSVAVQRMMHRST
jgi:cell division transport system permease protein